MQSQVDIYIHGFYRCVSLLWDEGFRRTNVHERWLARSHSIEMVKVQGMQSSAPITLCFRGVHNVSVSGRQKRQDYYRGYEIIATQTIYAHCPSSLAIQLNMISSSWKSSTTHIFKPSVANKTLFLLFESWHLFCSLG